MKTVKWEIPVLVGLLAAGLLFRGVYLAEIIDNPDFSHPAVDAGYHDYWARGLVTGNWTVPGGRDDPLIYRYPFYRPPGYTFFLALVYRLFGPGYLSPRIVQMAIGLAAGLLAYLLGRKWRSPSIGLLWALLISWYWIFIYFEGELVGVSLTVFLGLLLMAALDRAAARGGFPPSLGAGLILGLYVLFRPNLLLFLPVAAFWLARILRRGGEGRRWLPGVGGLIIGVFIMIAPVTIRNLAVSREFVPLTTNLGISLAVANNKITDGTTHVIPGIGDVGTPFDWPGIVRRLERKLGRRLSHREASRYLTGEALRFIGENPGRFARLLGRKTLLFWGPVEIRNLKEIYYARLNSPALRIFPGNFSLVMALAVLGILISFLELFGKSAPGRELSVLMLLFIGTYFLSLLPFAAAARYRVPLIPFLLFFGAVGLEGIGRFSLRGEWGRAARWAIAGALLYLVFSVDYAGFRPDREKWRYDLALACQNGGDFDQAVAHYQAVIRMAPESVKAYNNLGNIYALRGDTVRAIKCYRRALEINPDRARPRNNLGKVLYREGRIAEAIECYRAALRSRPDLAEARSNLGVALAGEGRLEEAVEEYRAALRYRPHDPVIYLNLAAALARRGEREEAIRAWEEAVRLRPDSPPAREALQLFPADGSVGSDGSDGSD